MAKNYQHRPPVKNNRDYEFEKLRTEYEALRTKCERLEVTVRMLTSEDKEDVINAAVNLKQHRELMSSPVHYQRGVYYYDGGYSSTSVYTSTGTGEVPSTTGGIWIVNR